MALISIKPTRTLLLKAIKDALESIPAESEKYKQDIKQYQKDLEAWAKACDYSPSNIKHVDTRVDHYENKVVDIKVVLKKYPANKPKRPTPPRFDGYFVKSAVQELEKVLRLLELSDEERVSASVANRVVEYI